MTVADLETDGVSESETKALTGRLHRELAETGKFTIVTENGAKAENSISGSVEKSGTGYRVTLKMAEVSSGNVIKEVAEEISGTFYDLLSVGIPNAARKTAGLKPIDPAKRIRPVPKSAPAHPGRIEVTIKSLCIPGWGEHSAGNHWGWLILGAEAAGIASAFIFPGKRYYFEECDPVYYADHFKYGFPEEKEFKTEEELFEYWAEYYVKDKSFFIDNPEYEVKTRNKYTSLILISTLATCHLGSAVWANLSLNKYNRKHRLTLVPDPGNNGLKLCMRF